VKRKEKFNILAIIITSIPLLGAIYSIKNIPPINTEAENEPKIALTSSNTPSEADYVVNWWSEDIYATHRYTEFHYRYVQRDSNAHVVLANYGNGGLIENTQPLIYNYTLTFKASAKFMV